MRPLNPRNTQAERGSGVLNTRASLGAGIRASVVTRAWHAVIFAGLAWMLTAAQPAHAILAGQKVYSDVFWVGLSLRGVLSRDGFQWGPAVELGVHPVQARTTWGSPSWMDDVPPDVPLNDRAISVSAWHGRWGPGPSPLSVDLALQHYRGYYPRYRYVPNLSVVVGWWKTADQHLATLGGTLSAGMHLNAIMDDQTGFVFPRGAVGTGVRLGPGASDNGGWIGGYADSSVAMRIIQRSR